MYPTKEEILSKKIVYSKKTIEKIEDWKKENWTNWKKLNNPNKILKLCKLISSLTNERKGVNINHEGKYYCYSPNEAVIQLDMENPSVISTLHEVAHHFYGASELQACRWSIGLFEKVFPTDFKKLHFDGHMLKLKL